MDVGGAAGGKSYFNQLYFISNYFFYHRLKVARLDNIFLTRMHWANVGGLSGELRLSCFTVLV